MDCAVKFTSIFGEHIENFLKEKRSLGFIYTTEEAILLRFDKYCSEKYLDDIQIDREFLHDWCSLGQNEKLANLNKRITAVRQFLLYMQSIGVREYLPATQGRPEIVVPHIFTAQEYLDFFETVDTYLPQKQPHCYRMANEYKVLFRIYACCGMRNTEAAGIAMTCVDLEEGVWTILNSKGAKDRLVYLPDDLAELCRSYRTYLEHELGFSSPWMFPGKDPQFPLPNTTVDSVFNRFWSMTPHAACCNNKPTVHDFRFTYITNRINLWASQGVNTNTMLPYLSAQCGHKSMKETYYYYHTSKELFDSIHSKDKLSAEIIPEANYE